MTHLHSFIVGTPQNPKQTPLTMDEITQRAPSALATRPYAAMSSKYAYIPTIDVIKGMIASGFHPFSATQSRARIEGKAEFSKHLIRFRHQDVARSLVVGDVVPEVVLINSHDGACAFRLVAGLYRLVCSNGLMVSDAEIASIVVRHTGNILQDVVDGSYRLTEDAGKALGTAQKWGQLQLTDGEQNAFAQAAHTLRFADAEGKTTTPITAAQLLAPRRYADAGNDLWKTFNRVQENVIAGGLSAIQRDANGQRVRRVSTRRIHGIDQDVKLNRALWQLAESMAELKGGRKAEVIEAGIVETAA
jgi:uncharacterized protein DUF932